MEKIIKRTISLTTKKRDSRNKLFEEFYSHDKNNAVFEFTVENGVPTEDIVVLFHFKRTNRHLEVRGRVDNDKIIVNFDTSLIIKDEQVAGYIYYENGEKSNDVYRFMFDVHVSEIDKEHDLPIMEQESKRIVPLTDIVTKSEITELLKKIVANEKLYDDTEIKQQINLKADKETVRAISSKVEALETNSGNRPTYDDAEIRGQIATKADTQSVEAIAQRVQTLENKTDNDTVYNDTELRQAIEEKADKQALLQYLPKSELTPINDKVQSLETNIGRMATQQQLESYVSKNELEQKGYLTSADTRNFALKSEIPVATNLDAINEKIKTLEEKQPVDLSHLATKQEIEDSHYLTREDIAGLATNSKVEAVESRVKQLENKPPVDLSNLATKHEIEDVVKTAELSQVTDRVASLEARPQIDTSKLVTKEELEAKGYLSTAPDLSEYAKKSEIPLQFDGSALTERINALENKAISNGAYNDKPLLDKIQEVQESLKGFITQSSRYLTEHQSLAHLVTKDELARMGYVTNHQSLEHLVTKEELEQKGYLKTHQSLENLVTKEELASKGYLTAHQDISNLATNSKVEAVESRVQTLENKPPVDVSNLATKQELEAVRGSQPSIDNHNFATKEELEAVRNSQSKVDTSNLVTKQELEDKHYINEHQSLANLVTKDELEAKGYLNAHQSLEEYAKKSEIPHIDTTSFATKEELSVVKQKQDTINTEAYVTKDELSQKGYLTAHQSLENVVTKAELEQKGYLTAHQDISNLVTKEELHEATEIDYSQIVTHEELEAKHYLQSHQSLAEYAKKTEIPNIDTSSFVTKQELEEKQYLKNHQSLDGYVKKSELPPQVDTSTFVSKQELTNMHLVDAEALGNVSKKMLEQTNKITALESKAEYEIHGTGMPNGTVSAPIGTTYVDMAVTNGALKWIKQSGTGNTGWKVLIGDTGWRTLNSVSRLGNSFIKIRRVNNLVTYNFGGLQWGWFGIIRRNGPGFARHNSTGERGAKVLAPNSIPEGFRSENSLIGGIYNDAGKPYGIWYLGGKSDSNYIQFSFNDPIPTDRDIGDIRVSAISYVTDEDWPTRLP